MNIPVKIAVFLLLFVSTIFMEPSIRTFLLVLAMALILTVNSHNVFIKLMLCVILFFTVIFIMMFKSYYINRNNYTKIQGDETLIVLGARIINDQPHVALRLRLDEAVKIMNKFPNIKCIVTGAQGSDELYTEASIMKKYLVEKGIDGARIFLEEKSTDTIGNFKLSKELIEKEALNPNIIITTNNYHAYRASLIADHFGMKYLLVSAPNKFFKTSVFNPFREVLSHIKVILLV